MEIQDIPFYEKIKDLNIIFVCRFGSHLYGNNTPESDCDYKGIYMPTAEQVILGDFPRTINLKTKEGNVEGLKNDNSDVDMELISLHYFIQLALKGETMAIDMLHAPEEMTIHTSAMWKEIQKNRSKFYTKKLDAFVGQIS